METEARILVEVVSIEVLRDRQCMTQSAPNVAKIAKFPLDQTVVGKFFAASVLKQMGVSPEVEMIFEIPGGPRDSKEEIPIKSG